MRFNGVAIAMKVAAVSTLTAAVLIGGANRVSATDFVSVDKSWWLALTSEEQIVALQAGMTAYRVGFGDGMVHAGMRLHKAQQSLDMTETDTPTFTKTFGYYQDAIDAFYSKYPAASTATIGVVMECLMDKPVLSCAQLAKNYAE